MPMKVIKSDINIVYLQSNPVMSGLLIKVLRIIVFLYGTESTTPWILYIRRSNYGC